MTSQEQARAIFSTVRMIQERCVRRHGAKLRGEGDMCSDLSFPQFNAVMAVRERQALTMKELAESLQVSAPSASAMVDRLVEMGVLTREQSQVDRREVVIRVSERGLASLTALEEQVLQGLVDLLEKLGPAMASQWTEVYSRIRSVIESEVGTEASAP